MARAWRHVLVMNWLQGGWQKTTLTGETLEVSVAKCCPQRCILLALFSCLVVEEVIEGVGNGCYTLWYAPLTLAERSTKLSHSFFRRLWVWNMHGSLLCLIFLYSILFYAMSILKTLTKPC
jgi:hypothetical protein